MAILPLFPELELLDARIEGAEIVLTLKNIGAFTMQTRTYGEPEYRLIAKLFDGDAVMEDRWLSLPCDLRPGETATIRFEHTKAVAAATALQTLKLYHALQDVPMLEPEPFAEVALVR